MLKIKSNLDKNILLQGISIIALFITFLVINTGIAYAQYPIKVNVQVKQPVTPYLPQLLGGLKGGNAGAPNDLTSQLRITLNNTGNSQNPVKLSGKIERLSPAPMSIFLRPSYAPPKPLILNPGQMIQSDRDMLNQAFGYFKQNDIIFNNTSLSALKQNGMNYKLPEGTYRICISAYDYNKAGQNGPLSAPGTGCATFMICYSASAPQLISPISTMGMQDANFQPFTPKSSQVQFTWTPPASTCGLPLGALTYDLSIRQVFPGQTVTDALFNPPVFQRENIHSTNFLLDTMRFPNVLRSGEKYIFRVKANFSPNPNSPLEIENQGYSQIGSFAFNEASSQEDLDQEEKLDLNSLGSIEEGLKHSPTRRITGRFTWSFKKSEVDYVEQAKNTSAPLVISPVAPIDKAKKKRSVGAERQKIDYDQQDENPNQNPYTNYYLGGGTIVAAHADAMAIVDPTLQMVSGSSFSNIRAKEPSTEEIDKNITEYSAEGMGGYISSNAAQSSDRGYIETGEVTEKEAHPLAGATVILKGISNPKLQKTITGEVNLQAVSEAKVEAYNERKEIDHAIQGVIRGLGGGLGGDILQGRGGVPMNGSPLDGRSGLPDSRMQNLPGGHGPSMRGYKNSNHYISGDFNTDVFPLEIGKELVVDTIVLATTSTDVDGNYTFHFVNPDFSLEDFQQLVVSVSAPGVYSNQQSVSITVLDSTGATDLGTKNLTANTYRLKTKINAPKIGGVQMKLNHPKVYLYRRTGEIARNPYLEYEGMAASGLNNTKNIDGTTYRLVGVDSVRNTDITSATFSFGKLFAGRLLAVIKGGAGNSKELHAIIRSELVDKGKPYTFNGRLDFETLLSQPAVKGRVILYAGENTIPVEGAIVQVTYDKDDVVVEESSAPNNFTAFPIPENSYGNPSDLGTNGDVTTAYNAVLVEGESAQMSYIDPLEASAQFSYGGVALPMEVTAIMNDEGTQDQKDTQQGNSYLVQGAEQMAIMDVTDGAKANEAVGGTELVRKQPGFETTLDWYGIGLNYTTSTDENGNFYLGNLPSLKEGAKYTIKLVSVPDQFKNLAVNPANKEIPIHVYQGMTEEAVFSLEAESVSLKGKVVNSQKEPLPYARLHFEGSDSYFETDESGAFETDYYPGNHTLIVEKVGYVEKQGEVEITKSKVKVKPPLVVIEKLEERRYERTITGRALPLGSIVKVSELNMGNIGFLKKKKAKVRFIVKDKDDPNKSLEKVTIKLFDTTHLTNQNGEWIYEGYGGKVDVTLIPEQGSGYIPNKTSVDLKSNNQLFDLTLYLEKGVRLYGTISSGGNPLDSANISIEGRDYIKTLSGSNGFYELFVPAGKQEIRAAKIGYVGERENKTFSRGSGIEVNFDLEDGGGKNISELLGFDIELMKKEGNGNGVETWSGSFVNLESYIPTLKSEGGAFLPFTDIKVEFDENGNAVPLDGEIITDKAVLPVTFFDYIPLNFKDNDNPIIVKDHGGWGTISGQIVFDVSRILGEELAFAQGFLPQVITQERSTPGSMVVFLGKGAALGMLNQGVEALKDKAKEEAQRMAGELERKLQEQGRGNESIPNKEDIKDALNTANEYVVDLEKFKFRLAPLGSDPVKIGLYGFNLNLDLAQTLVSPEGIELAGTVVTPEVGPISSFEIPLSKLLVTPSFDVGELELDLQNIPDLEIGDWKASLDDLLLNRNGIKVSGSLSVKLPSSKKSSLHFTDLRISTDGVYGGKFKVSSDGLDLFGAAVIKDNGSKIKFGEVGNSGVYKISGSVDIAFKKLIEEEINIPRFQFQTNGKFLVQVPAHHESDFGFIKYKLHDLVISNPEGQMPYIKLLGKLNTDIDIIKFEASDIKIQATSSGVPTLRADEISAELNAPVIKSGLTLGLREDEIKGGGMFNIPGTNFGAELQFHYKNTAAELDVGALLQANTPEIPIGGIASLSNPGGEFNLNKNRTNHKWKVNVALWGDVSFTGTGNLTKLSTLKLDVTAQNNGARIRGTGKVVVGNTITLAEAAVDLDFPRSRFLVEVKSKLQPADGLSINTNGELIVSWKENNYYAFLGARTSVKLAGLFEANGEFAVGVNVKDPAGNPDTKAYFAHLDKNLIGYNSNYVFTGLYGYGGVEKHINLHAFNISIGKFDLISVSANYDYSASANVFVNFSGNNTYVLGMRGSVGGNASATVVGLTLGGGFDACFAIQGGKAYSGWFLHGSVGMGGYVEFNPGDVGCDEIHYAGGETIGTVVGYASFGLWHPKPDFIPVGGKGCFDVYATVDYQQPNKLKLDGGLGGGGTSTSCP